MKSQDNEKIFIRKLGEAREWIERSEGAFSSFVFGKETDFQEVSTRNDILFEFVQSGLIEPTGSRSGWYKKIDKGLIEIDWRNAYENPYPIWLPFGISDMCQVAPKNVIVLAGESNAGKSEAALEIAFNNLRQNGGEHNKINYFSCEFSPQELKTRTLIRGRQIMWDGFLAYERYENYHSVIEPDEFNIIDYLEVHDNFYLMGKYLDLIHQTLRGGIAVVCIQKHAGHDLGMGGQFSTHRTRLALSMSYNRDTHLRTIKIIKCKHPKTEIHPDGMQLDYKFENGKAVIVNEWAHITKDQREARDNMAAALLREKEQSRMNSAAREKLKL